MTNLKFEELLLEFKDKIPSYVHRSLMAMCKKNTILQEKIYSELYKKRVIEDLTQEVLLKMVKYSSSYDPNKPFNPWLNSVVRSVCVDFINSNKERFSLEMASPTGSWDNFNFYSGQIVDYNLLLNRLSKSLPEHLRKVFKGFYVDGKPQTQISKDLNLGLRTVSRYITKIKEILKDV